MLVDVLSATAKVLGDAADATATGCCMLDTVREQLASGAMDACAEWSSMKVVLFSVKCTHYIDIVVCMVTRSKPS